MPVRLLFYSSAAIQYNHPSLVAFYSFILYAIMSTDIENEDEKGKKGSDRGVSTPRARAVGAGPSDELPELELSCTTSSSSALTLGIVEPSPSTPDQPVKNKKSSPEEREKMAREFILSKGLNISYDTLDDEGKLRAKRLMSADFSWSPSHEKKGNRGETTFREQCDLFCNMYSEWSDLSRWFFHQDKDAMDNYLVIRRQKAGICYMHAVAVYQHYVQYRRQKRQGSGHEMLDLSWYIRERFSTERLENFITKGGGSSSIGFLCEITGNDWEEVSSLSLNPPKKSRKSERFKWVIAEICHNFKASQEPALVSGFCLEEDFKSPGKYYYHGEVKKEKLLAYGEKCKKPKGSYVKHSMVLIALYQDKGRDEVWFLLQNFWANKYLVVVSAEYLASCYASVTFLDADDNVSLPHDLVVIDAHYSETETTLEECEEDISEENEATAAVV